MTALPRSLGALELTPTGDASFTAGHLDGGHGVVFGGQLLAQSLLAAARVVPDKDVASLHTVFTRGATFDEPLMIEVEVLQSGRSFSSASVSITQRRGITTQSLILLQRPDEHLIRHQDPMPEAGRPDDHAPIAHGGFWEARIVGDVDINDPALIGPPGLMVWSRFPDAPDDLTTSQALLTYASDGFLIATAMRPHPGFGQALAHVSVATTVLTQTVTFHEPFRAGEWLLLDQRSVYAGRGRSHGSANVYREDGQLVASFTQENMVRALTR